MVSFVCDYICDWVLGIFKVLFFEENSVFEIKKKKEIWFMGWFGVVGL